MIQLKKSIYVMIHSGGFFLIISVLPQIEKDISLLVQNHFDVTRVHH